MGPLLFTFSTLLTRWQQLAVPGCRRAEDQTATGPVVVGGLAKLVAGADAGIPLVSRQAGTIGKPIRLDFTLCNRGKGRGRGQADWGNQLHRMHTCLMSERLWGWVSGIIPK